jgi:hypothetical protein
MNRIEKLIAELLIDLVFCPPFPLDQRGGRPSLTRHLNPPFTKEVGIRRFDELPKFPFSKGVAV